MQLGARQSPPLQLQFCMVIFLTSDPMKQPALVQVSYVKGWGSFTSANDIDVAMLDGGNQTVSGKNIIISTGSEVTPLPGIPIDEEK